MSSKPENELSITDKKKLLKEEVKLKEMQEQKKKSRLENIKILISLVVLAVGFVLFYELTPVRTSIPYYVKAIFPVASVVAFIALILFWCDSGKNLIRYIKGSVVELKKVVWPARNDALRQTLFVLVFVFILAGFTWLADSGLKWVIYKLILGVGS